MGQYAIDYTYWELLKYLSKPVLAGRIEVRA